MLAALHASRRRLLSALTIAPLLAAVAIVAVLVGRSSPAPSLSGGLRQANAVAGGGSSARDVPLPAWPGARAAQPSTATTTSSPRAVPGLHPDPEAAQSFAQTRADIHHRAAATPTTAAVAPGAPSDAEVRAELRQMHAALAGPATAGGGGGSVGGNGSIPIPPGVPAVIQRVIAGGNAIATFPYVYGGGHASFVDNAYDCSGSVSYALAAGGLLRAPEASGPLESYGDPGPGRWITIYANAGHVWMVVNGVRFDTSGRSGVHGSRWQSAARSTAGFVVRHPPGL